MDDEVDCNTCPVNCECNGYSAMCILNNSKQIFKNDTHHMKALTLKGMQLHLSIKYFNFKGLVY